jgi:hypothetical protein
LRGTSVPQWGQTSGDIFDLRLPIDVILGSQN